MSWVREARGVLRDEEAADALVGARPDDGDVGDRAVGDPHLLAVQDPVVAVAAGAGAHRAGIGAGVGLGQAEAADRLAGGHPRAATAASAPRSPSARSRTSPASPAPRRGCACRCRRPRAPCRRGRRRSRWRRRSRSPPGACRARRARRARCASSRGIVASSNHSPTFGTTRSLHERADGVADVALLVGEQVRRCARKSWGRISRAGDAATDISHFSLGRTAADRTRRGPMPPTLA